MLIDTLKVDEFADCAIGEILYEKHKDELIYEVFDNVYKYLSFIKNE
jgi:hypothetical protein